MITWTRDKKQPGYECSSIGDKRFSAFGAIMPDGRSIECWYQCDIKGYDIGGRNWKLGKGKPPIFPFTAEQLYDLYLNLWRLWAIRNGNLMVDLLGHATVNNNTLRDVFASTPVNQARALAQILNEWIIPNL